MPGDGSGSSLSPHLAGPQMLFIFFTLFSLLTKATEFLGSVKTVCHRVPWVKCMLLRKAFPFVCLFDGMFGDLQHLPWSRSPSSPATLLPNALPLAPLCSPRCLLALLRSTRCYLLATQRFLESSGMLIFATHSAKCWEQRRRLCSFTQFYDFLPLVSIPKAAD